MSTDNEEAWRIATVAAQKCSSFLSVMGSGYILVEVLRSPAKRSKVVFRLLASMSASDFFCSIWFFVGTWAVPAGTPGIPSGVGTETTCNIQAFFLYAAVTTLNFNACLALYYLVSIRLGWREDKIRKYIEPYCYLYAISVGLVVGMVPLIMDLFNPSNFWCSIKPKPNGPSQYMWLLFYIPAWLTILFVTVTMTIIYIHVRKTEVKAHRHDFQGANNNKRNNHSTAEVSDDDDSICSSHSHMSHMSHLSAQSIQSRISKVSASIMSIVTNSSGANGMTSVQIRQHRYKQTAKVATQAVWYCLVFYLTMVFPTTTRAMQMANQPVPQPILFCFMVFYPLQGFMNWLVYMRPRWVTAIRLRRERAKRQRRNQQANNGQHATAMTTTHSTAANGATPTPSSVKVRNKKGSSLWIWRSTTAAWRNSNPQQQSPHLPQTSSLQIDIVDEEGEEDEGGNVLQEIQEEEEESYYFIVQEEESSDDNLKNQEPSCWDEEAAATAAPAEVTPTTSVTTLGTTTEQEDNNNNNNDQNHPHNNHHHDVDVDREYAWKQSLKYAKELEQDGSKDNDDHNNKTADSTTSQQQQLQQQQQDTIQSPTETAGVVVMSSEAGKAA